LRDDGRAGFAYYNATANSNATVNINRTGSDGDLIRLFKSGTTVGSIGTVSGDIRIGGLDDNHASIRFAASSKAVLPVKNSDGDLSDNTTDLGASNARFKNLYLSGGINNGTNAIAFSGGAFAGDGAGNDANIDLGRNNRRFQDLYLSGNALVGRTSSLSGQSGSVSANTVVSAHGGLQSHATSAGILEHYNDETLLRSYGANAGSGKLVFKVGGGGGSADSEAMRIDSSGNVGIGVSPSQKLHVYQSATNSQAYVTVQNNRSRNAAVLTQTTNGGFYTGTSIGTDTFCWQVYDVSAGERMRIDSSGNITAMASGTAMKAPLLQATNANVATYTGTTPTLHSPSSGTLAFSMAGGERMRIDSSGNLLVGSTNVSASVGGGIKLNAGLSAKTISVVSANSNSVSEGLTMWSSGANAWRFYVGWDGTIHATSTSIAATSDERLKENIVDLETGLTEVMALKPRRFDWKNGDGENIAGFVAQEVETVLPDLVVPYKHEDFDAKGLKMGDMLPTLVKAIQEQQTLIQEQQTLIESLTTRVAALEE
jgi:hypothetical protein